MGQTSSIDKELSPIKRALRAVDDMQAKLAAVEYAKTEPIAIIGMGCRFPGGADTPEAYWQLLADGVDAIADVPEGRWDIDAYYDPDPDVPGKIYTRKGGFLPEIDQFDASFFGISAREAGSLDPQQRLLLQVSWEALENANQANDGVFNSTTGVFMGICSNDYNKMIWESGGADRVDAFCATGNALSVAAGRLSYALGLKGPSLAVDTACSSSLVALHMACQNLRRGECDLALAGGVHLLLSPDSSVAFSRTRMIDPSGRCKTFDASASGYGRGEGCGVVVLKRLSDALGSGDDILAVIKGSAVNHNGRSSSLIAPNGPAQQAVIRGALEMAGVEPQRVGYVEVQGTGTAVGQSIEVGALAKTLGAGRSPEHPLAIGSVKTNFGHLEGASGMASLLKLVLSLQHQTIPPHLHFEQPNPHIDWDHLPVEVPTKSQPWPAQDGLRVGGINCFGFSGTNVHVIVEEAPIQSAATAESKASAAVERPRHLLALSAKNETSLRQLAQRYHQYLEAHPNVRLADVCFTANTGRAHFSHRLAIPAASAQELAQQLSAFGAGATSAGRAAAVTEPPKVAFAFPNAGYRGMGQALYETQPVFRAALDQCSEIFGNHSAPISDILYGSDDTAALSMAVPADRLAIFAVEYGLCQLWRAWGLEPALLMGSGVGEYVSACVAGVFSLEVGLKLMLDPAQIPPLSRPIYPLLSASKGQLVTSAVSEPDYWRDRTFSPTPGTDVQRALAEHSVTSVLTLGPLPQGDRGDIPHLASLAPKADSGRDWATLLDSLAQLYTLGAPVDWAGFDKPYPRQPLHLPTYAWRQQRYWHSDLDGGAGNGAGLAGAAADQAALYKKLTATGALSAAELELLPKVLTLLTETATSSPPANGDSASGTGEAIAIDRQNLSAADIQAWLVNRIAQELGVAAGEINPKAPFDSYGLDSVLAIGIAAAGKQHFGVEVTPLMMIQHPDIESLSNHLAAEFEASETEVFEL